MLMRMDEEEQLEKQINMLEDKIQELEKEKFNMKESYENKITKLKQKNYERKNMINDLNFAKVSMF